MLLASEKLCGEARDTGVWQPLHVTVTEILYAAESVLAVAVPPNCGHAKGKQIC